MPTKLEQVLATTRAAILEELAGAELELEDLRAASRELEVTIARAKAALAAADATAGPHPSDPGRRGALPTLHEAMARALVTSKTGCLTAPQLRTAIVREGLYKRRNNQPVELQQIHARVSNYPKWFERREGGICLRPGAPGASRPNDGTEQIH